MYVSKDALVRDVARDALLRAAQQGLVEDRSLCRLEEERADGLSGRDERHAYETVRAFDIRDVRAHHRRVGRGDTEEAAAAYRRTVARPADDRVAVDLARGRARFEQG